MVSITDTAFPCTGIPCTEVMREPGCSGVAEHWPQEVNDQVEHTAHKAELLNGLAPQVGPQFVERKAWRVQPLRRAASNVAKSMRARTKCPPLTAAFCGVALHVVMARAVRR